MESEEEMIEWINNASYEDLFRRWRYALSGDAYFHGKVGEHYSNVMYKKRQEIGDEEHTRISKKIGPRS